jgi:hypothetical protein
MNSILLHFKRYIVALYFGRCVYLRRNFTFSQQFHRWHVCRWLSSVSFIVCIRPKKHNKLRATLVTVQLHFKAMWCKGRPKIWRNCYRREENFRSHLPQKNCLRLWASAVISRYNFPHMWLNGHASWQTGPTSLNADKDHRCHRHRPPLLFLLH